MRKALVVGSAACLWNDVAAARALTSFDAIYCVKLTGVDWPERFDVWCGLHPEWMADYVVQRKAKGLPDGYEIVVPLEKEVGRKSRDAMSPDMRRCSYLWPGMNASASSGIYGAKVALDDGFDRVVLAGVPMDNSNHFSRGKPWLQLDSFLKGLKLSIPHLKGRVRSMSGRTRDLLGAPSPEWLGLVATADAEPASAIQSVMDA